MENIVTTIPTKKFRILTTVLGYGGNAASQRLIECDSQEQADRTFVALEEERELIRPIYRRVTTKLY